jgi:hypothetical protein
MVSLTVYDCTPDRWDDVVAVFEGPGDRRPVVGAPRTPHAPWSGCR